MAIQLKEFKGLSIGQSVDMVHRKFQLRRWRQREEIAVQCAGQTARLRVRRGTTDADVIHQCFVENQYEIPTFPNVKAYHREAVQERYSSIVADRRKPLIIDCGANMGASAAWLDLRFPGSAIVAVEPAEDNILLLKENCKTRKNIQVVEAGVGGVDENAFLQDFGGGHWGYQTGKEQTDKPIRIVSLSSLIKANTNDAVIPFMLKIDVEGAEKELFGPSLETIAAFPVIVIETHDFYMPGARTASPFFRFHADTGRDFLFSHENVFSIDMDALRAPTAGR